MILNRIFIVAFLGVLLLTGCKHNRPDEPSARINPNAKTTPTHTIAELRSLYNGTPTTITDNVVVEAVMASDDSEGNLYRTAYIQDATGGMELKLSLGNLSTIYPQGAKIQLHARGMTLGKYGDQINIGYRSADARYETAYYPELLVPSVLHFVSPGSIDPQTVTIPTLSTKLAGRLVHLSNVQFIASELGQTYAAPENKETQSAVNRTLTDRSGKTIIVRTSSYAKFAGKKIPAGSGNITALLTYFRTTPQLILLREQDAELNAPRF